MTIKQNLESILNISIPRPPDPDDSDEDDANACAICMSFLLPIIQEVKSTPEIRCEGCSLSFHPYCLKGMAVLRVMC